MDEPSRQVSALMHRFLGRAVAELRRQKQWDQTRLAKEIHRYHRGADRLPEPTQRTISRWETASNLPSTGHRLALAKIAATHNQASLHETFSATDSAWRLLAAVVDLGIATESDDSRALDVNPVVDRHSR